MSSDWLCVKQLAPTCKPSMGSLSWRQQCCVSYSLKSLARSWLRAIVCPTDMAIFNHMHIFKNTILVKIFG